MDATIVAVVCAGVCHLVCDTHILCFARQQDVKRQKLREFVQRALDDDDVEDVMGDLYKARVRTPAVFAKVTVDDLVNYTSLAPLVATILVKSAMEERGACFVPFRC